MSMRKLSVLALLVIVPMSTEAQGRRGGGGGGGGGGGAVPTADDCRAVTGDRGLGGGGGASDARRMINCMADSPSLSKDLQKANPLEFLLDKKKDLQLSGDEEKELKSLNNTVKDAIKPYLRTIDSVDREMKKTGEYAPTTGQMLIGRRLKRESQDSVAAVYGAATTTAFEKLAEPHRQPAMDMLQKEREAQMAARRGGRPPV